MQVLQKLILLSSSSSSICFIDMLVFYLFLPSSSLFFLIFSPFSSTSSPFSSFIDMLFFHVLFPSSCPPASSSSPIIFPFFFFSSSLFFLNRDTRWNTIGTLTDRLTMFGNLIHGIKFGQLLINNILE